MLYLQNSLTSSYEILCEGYLSQSCCWQIFGPYYLNLTTVTLGAVMRFQRPVKKYRAQFLHAPCYFYYGIFHNAL